VNGYKANAFTPQSGSKVLPGILTVTHEGLRFESGAVSGNLPLHGLQVRRGGHNDEQIFFEHPEFPGWSIYSSDPALGKDPALRGNPAYARQFKAVEKSRRSTPKPVLFGLAFVALILLGIVFLWTQKDTIAEYIANRIPISWETSFGDRVFAQFASNENMLTNSPWEGPVSNITSRLLPVVSKSGYEFKFHIMQDTNVNAFAIPGGHIVILTGLLEEAESAEEVAGVLAHEIAHVTRRHSLRNVIKSAGLLVTVQALLGDASGLFGLAAEASRYLLEQKFSRDFEREADDTGWAYLVEANIDPRGMRHFFEKLKVMLEKSGMSVMENSLALVNTHPTSQERIDRLAAKWEQTEKKTGFVDLGSWKKPDEAR
jgi:Zn-dependent protease with chaperone function